MRKEKLIAVEELCLHYQVDISFFSSLKEFGLIEIRSVEQSHYVHEDKLTDIEKMIRMNRELNINPEGIDAIFNLLDKIDQLQVELNEVKNRLRNYEE